MPLILFVLVWSLQNLPPSFYTMAHFVQYQMYAGFSLFRLFLSPYFHEHYLYMLKMADLLLSYHLILINYIFTLIDVSPKIHVPFLQKCLSVSPYASAWHFLITDSTYLCTFIWLSLHSLRIAICLLRHVCSIFYFWDDISIIPPKMEVIFYIPHFFKQSHKYIYNICHNYWSISFFL